MTVELPRSRPRATKAIERSEARAREQAPVLVLNVRAALAERLGVSREVLGRRVDWVEALVTAVPFQDEAAREVGRALQVAHALRGMIAGIRLAICNARDWGEEELIEAIADHGYGDPRAVCRLNLRPFWSSDAIGVLLEATLGNSEVAEGISLLARVLQARRSGVLVLQNFDAAHPIVQQFLLEGVKRGRMTDFRGRELHVRAFTTVFLLNQEPRSRGLGFRPHSGSQSDHDDLLSGAVDAATSLAPPDIARAPRVVLGQAVRQFAQETGLDVKLSPEAEAFLGSMSASDGLSAYRERVSRVLVEAVAEALDGHVLDGRGFDIVVKGGRLQAFRRRRAAEEPA
jgi:hypothetical protein